MALRHVSNYRFFMPDTGKATVSQIREPAPQSFPIAAKKLVDVAREGNCGFLSVAAGLIDQALSTATSMDEATFERLFTRFFQHFPSSRLANTDNLTQQQIIQKLIKTMSMGTFLESLAYTLRQVAVEQMYRNPPRYRGAFEGAHFENASPEDMSKLGTWIDETSIAALADALAMPIEVKFVQPRKELPLSFKYNTFSGQKPAIAIQLNNGHYQPYVSNPHLFQNLSHTAIKVPEPTLTEQEISAMPLEKIHALIEEDDRRLAKLFEQTKFSLATKVKAGEVNKKDLLNMYIHGMGSDYLQGYRLSCIGSVQGSQDVFRKILKDEPETKDILLQDEQIVEDLVHAIARAISIGHMDKETVLGLLDNEADQERAPTYF